jgi:regulatory protein
MEEAQRAFIYALRTLTRRDHSEAELRRKLAGREFSAEVAERTIGRLKEAGYLDDRKYALNWAESAIRNGRGYGYRVRFELSRRGIAEDLASEVMAQVSAEFGETDTLKALVQKKFPGYVPSSADERQKRRMIGYLQRRGFSLTAILQVLRAADSG